MNFDHYDTIELYLNGKLTASENQAFESALNKDDALKAKVDSHHLANELIIDNRLLAVSRQLNIQHQQTKKIQKVQKVALGIISSLILASVVFFTNTSSIEEPKKPFDVTSTEDNIITKESTGTETNSQQTKSDNKVPHVAPTPEHSTPQLVEAPSSTPTPARTYAEPVVESTTLSKTKEQAGSTSSVPVDMETLCAQTKISAEITSSGSCPNTQEGTIRIDNLQGGATPYEVFVTDQQGVIKQGLTSLSPGVYAIDIVDANGCLQSMKTIAVNSLNCAKTLVFNPYSGEEIHFHDHYDKGHIKVYNQQSIVVFEGDLNKEDKLTWNGYNKFGKIEEGYYIFSVEMPDGTTQTGEITLLK